MSTLQNLFAGFRALPILSPSSWNEGGRTVSLIREQRAELATIADDQLETRASRLREHVINDRIGNLTPFYAEAFALVDEAANRAVGVRFYDVQLLAGLSLVRGEIAEMKTGEGKTYVGALASFAKSLHGRGVHFMTTNDYLASRDHEIVSPIFARLGFSIGLLKQTASPREKQIAYGCDVTYGPGYEFGFDYLRDQLALIQQPQLQLGQQYQTHQRGDAPLEIFKIQRDHFCAVIDEADSVLIDEATTPLILSGASSQSCEKPEPFLAARRLALDLRDQEHFTIDPSKRQVKLTKAGTEEARKHLTDSTRSALGRPWVRYVEQALQAEHVLAIDVDYVTSDGKIKIVDQNTGRVFDDRTWSDGLHQAVEAKERLEISQENRALARVSRQQYFRLYETLCGMTGTALDARRELSAVYKLSVTEIPTHKPCCRQVLPTRFFGSEPAKFNAIAEDVARLHRAGRPVLIGTRTIRQSEAIAHRLAQRNLKFQLLNGKQDADEAKTISLAGQPGAITIATNMAGRGTDIKLDERVVELGGLHVIVSEPHDSARVDRQLIGRAARQGDPGSCQTFVSADDAMISQHAAWLARYLRRIAPSDQEAAADLSRDVSTLQKAVERKLSAARRKMFSAEHWLEEVLAKLAGQ